MYVMTDVFCEIATKFPSSVIFYSILIINVLHVMIRLIVSSNFLLDYQSR